MRRTIRESSAREIAEATQSPDYVLLQREDRTPALQLSPEIIEQLEKNYGPANYLGSEPPLGPDLYAKPQKVVRITMERAVVGAAHHNLNVEFARLGPAINQQQYIAADAAFDWVVFANSQFTGTNEPRTDSFDSGVGGTQTFVTSNVENQADLQLGLRKALVSGGTFTLQTELQNTYNNTPNFTVLPNPAREANFVIELDQPLLRGFGSDVTLAQVRLARNAELDQIAQLKNTLLQNVNDTEGAYWKLVEAKADLQILVRLLAEGEEVLQKLNNRKVFDADPATISNAVATVQSRSTDVIRAQRVVHAASDKLKVLMNDPEFPIGSETLVLPADMPVDQPIQFSLVDAINSALANRPEMQRAVLSLDNTSIRQVVADNGRLPKLDMKALTRFSGLGPHLGSPYSEIGEADFVDYQIGLMFEQPIGNRAAEALYRQRRIERLQATLAYRNTIQGIVGDVKSALRDLQTNYILIGATKTSRIAAAEDVRTILAKEMTTQGLTPEFLNLKLQRQQALAAAQQSEITALIDYNTAMAQLYTATGTGLERNGIKFSAANAIVEPSTSDLFPDFPLEPKRPSADEIRRK